MTIPSEGELERTVNSTLAAGEAPTSNPVFNFNGEIVYQQTFSSYRFNDRDVNAHLLIKRKKGRFDFLLFLRYGDGILVLKRRGREVNFADTNTNGFTDEGLLGYIKQEGLEIKLPADVSSLESEYTQLNLQNQSIWADESISGRVRYAKSERLKKRMKELDVQIVQKKIQLALEQVGQQWIEYIKPYLRLFIEEDGTNWRHRGLGGGGPHLRNYLRAEQISPNYSTRSIPLGSILPGSYGSGKRSR